MENTQHENQKGLKITAIVVLVCVFALAAVLSGARFIKGGLEENYGAATPSTSSEVTSAPTPKPTPQAHPRAADPHWQGDRQCERFVLF